MNRIPLVPSVCVLCCAVVVAVTDAPAWAWAGVGVLAAWVVVRGVQWRR
jgi:hypothetical protein